MGNQIRTDREDAMGTISCTHDMSDAYRLGYLAQAVKSHLRDNDARSLARLAEAHDVAEGRKCGRCIYHGWVRSADDSRPVARQEDTTMTTMTREITILRAEAAATHNRALLATLDDAEAGSVDALVTIAKLLAAAAQARASLYCATCETITRHDRVGDHDVCERHDSRPVAR